MEKNRESPQLIIHRTKFFQSFKVLVVFYLIKKNLSQTFTIHFLVPINNYVYQTPQKKKFSHLIIHPISDSQYPIQLPISGFQVKPSPTKKKTKTVLLNSRICVVFLYIVLIYSDLVVIDSFRYYPPDISSPPIYF